MAILTKPQLGVLRVRLFDFRKKLVAYTSTIENQVFGGLALTPNLQSIKARFDTAKANINEGLNRLDGVIAGRTLDGELVTDTALLPLIQSFQPNLNAMQQAVAEWNASSPIGVLASSIGKLGSAVAASYNATLDVVGGIGTSVSAATKWLPWVILGLIVIPPTIRIILRARKGGVDAALEETASQIDEGKRKAGEAARKAGSVIATAAKTAAKFAI